ncbi:MAG: hypothetical protein ABS873_05690, partial [Alkalibacterium sp.]
KHGATRDRQSLKEYASLAKRDLPYSVVNKGGETQRPTTGSSLKERLLRKVQSTSSVSDISTNHISDQDLEIKMDQYRDRRFDADYDGDPFIINDRNHMHKSASNEEDNARWDDVHVNNDEDSDLEDRDPDDDDARWDNDGIDPDMTDAIRAGVQRIHELQAHQSNQNNTKKYEEPVSHQNELIPAFESTKHGIDVLKTNEELAQANLSLDSCKQLFTDNHGVDIFTSSVNSDELHIAFDASTVKKKPIIVMSKDDVIIQIDLLAHLEELYKTRFDYQSDELTIVGMVADSTTEFTKADISEFYTELSSEDNDD